MSTKKFQQLMLHKKRQPHQRRGSVDCGPEEWPTDEHIAAPLAPPSAEAATFDLLNELRDMTVYIPAPAFSDEAEPSAKGSSPGRHSPQQSSDAPAPPRALEGVVTPLDGEHGSAAVGSPYRALRVRLPTSDELPTYPEQFANHLKEVALSTIRTMLYPRILLRRRLRQRAKTDVPSDQTPKLTAQLMATTPLFKNWPMELIQQLSKEATYSSHEQRDIIVYEGEVPRALYFIVTGTCKLMTRATRPQQLLLSPSNKGLPGVGGNAAAASTGTGTGNVAPSGTAAVPTTSVSNGMAALLRSPRQAAVAPRNKRINSANCTPASLAISPVSFGSANLLTNEPYGQTLRALGKVEVYTISRAAFSKVLALVPPQVSSHTISTAFERRNEKMTSRFPISVARLKAYNLFSRISDDFAALIISKLEPHAVPANFTLLRGGQICESMFFVESGTIGHFRVDENGALLPSAGAVLQSSSASPGGVGRASPATGATAAGGAPTTHELLMTVTAPTLVGDSALMYNSANETQVTTLSDCDCYALSKHTFATLCRQHPTEVDTMLDAARDQRKAELRSNHLRFRAVITNMPILRDLVPPQFERDFLNRFTPKSYRPMSCVCSTSNFCDKVMVLTKGKLQLGSVKGASDVSAGKKKDDEHYLLKRWESIGWSCVVPHRWGQTAMAQEKTVETLELSYLDLMLFLHERGLLDKVTRIVKVLMFPRAHRDTVVADAVKLVGEHFPMYPISQSLHVNLYEMGFCSVHMSALDEAEMRDRERHASELALNPPVYRQLSKGLWVPLPTTTGKGPRM